MDGPLVTGLLVVSLLTGTPVAQHATVDHPHDHRFVVDRIADTDAVLLVEADDETIDSRRVPTDSLPPDAREEGTVLLETSHGYAVDSRATTTRSNTATRRLEHLSTRLPEKSRGAAG